MPKTNKQFGKAIIDFPAVYDMLSIMKAKLDAGRALLYQTSRYVDIYKALDDICPRTQTDSGRTSGTKSLRQVADSFTPLSKGMNSEYATKMHTIVSRFTVVQVSWWNMPCQRIYRDTRITSIYEGTTQLQTVAAIRYVTNGSYIATLR